MGRARIRLRDIAESTGYSINTVSLALRDNPRIPVATRHLIQSKAREMNYLPNRIAQSLVSSQSMTIGLLLTDILNPVLTEVAQQISTNLTKKGYSTLFATSNNTISTEREAIDTFRGRQADGLLVFPTDHQNLGHLRTLRENGYPVVSLVADTQGALDTVSADDREGSRLAAQHLLNIGHTKIALLDAASPLGNTEKSDGYVDAFRDANLPVDPAMMIPVTGHGMNEGYLAMQDLWKSGARPTAILATNDSLALGVARWCSENAIAVPDDLAIVGFDNIEFARLATVPITTVAYPVKRVAELAVEHLLRLIDADAVLPAPRETKIVPSLLLRQSTLGKTDTREKSL